MVDSAGIEVNRRARRAKTDCLDGGKLLTMLLRSVLAGVLLAITLMALNHLLHRIAYRSKHIERAMEGSPQVLIHSGQIIRAVADSASLTDEDIRAELRKSGITDVAGVRWAILETDGHISVIPHHHVAA